MKFFFKNFEKKSVNLSQRLGEDIHNSYTLTKDLYSGYIKISQKSKREGQQDKNRQSNRKMGNKLEQMYHRRGYPDGQ